MPPLNKSGEKRATIYDLAREAGVSPGTASRVLNNRDRVNAKTRARVLAAACELNLKPRAGVRMQQIAIISEPNFNDRIEGYAARLSAYLSFSLARTNATVLHPSDPVSQLSGKFLDGIVAVTCAQQGIADLLADLEQRIPVVYMDRFDAKPNQYTVCSDHYQAGYLAAQYFIARGKKRLSMIGEDFLPMRERLRGYRRAIEEAGLVPDERLLHLPKPFSTITLQASIVTQKVRTGADAMFAPGASYEGMFCLHVLSYVMGLQIPAGIGLITGEIPGISAISNPPLTTIEEPLSAMAERAAEMIIRLAANENVEDRHVTIPVRLVERASVY